MKRKRRGRAMRMSQGALIYRQVVVVCCGRINSHNRAGGRDRADMCAQARSQSEVVHLHRISIIYPLRLRAWCPTHLHLLLWLPPALKSRPARSGRHVHAAIGASIPARSLDTSVVKSQSCTVRPKKLNGTVKMGGRS